MVTVLPWIFLSLTMSCEPLHVWLQSLIRKHLTQRLLNTDISWVKSVNQYSELLSVVIFFYTPLQEIQLWKIFFFPISTKCPAKWSVNICLSSCYEPHLYSFVFSSEYKQRVSRSFADWDTGIHAKLKDSSKLAIRELNQRMFDLIQ